MATYVISRVDDRFDQMAGRCLAVVHAFGDVFQATSRIFPALDPITDLPFLPTLLASRFDKRLAARRDDAFGADTPALAAEWASGLRHNDKTICRPTGSHRGRLIDSIASGDDSACRADQRSLRLSYGDKKANAAPLVASTIETLPRQWRSSLCAVLALRCP